MKSIKSKIYILIVLGIGISALILFSGLAGFNKNFINFKNFVASIALNNSQSPNLKPLSDFVLFASEELKLEKDIQVSSGDLGSNKNLDIQKDAIINGNLFADKITIDRNTQINGNASFNKLKIQKDAQILGNQIKPVSLPIANLPDIPDFSIGTENFKFQGQDNILSAGNYRDLILEKDSRLVLSGGIYNLRKLELKEKSVLVFSAPATLNIQFKLMDQKNVSILPGQNLAPQDLSINYLGIRPRYEKEEKEDDDEEIEGLLDENERKDCHEGKIGRPVIFGQNSFLNFKLLAPKTKVHIGESITLRGNIWGKEIHIGENSILSLGMVFVKELDPQKVIIDSEKSIYPVNEVIVNFANDATIVDAQSIAELIHGTIVGYISFANAYQIEVSAASEIELDVIIDQIKSLDNPKIEGAFPNFIHRVEDL